MKDVKRCWILLLLLETKFIPTSLSGAWLVVGNTSDKDDEVQGDDGTMSTIFSSILRTFGSGVDPSNSTDGCSDVNCFFKLEVEPPL